MNRIFFQQYNLTNLNLFLVDLILSPFIKKFDPFVTQKVGDLLFNGYKDQFTKDIAFLLEKLPIKVEGPRAIDKNGMFSLLGAKNNSGKTKYACFCSILTIIFISFRLWINDHRYW